MTTAQVLMALVYNNILIPFISLTATIGHRCRRPVTVEETFLGVNKQKCTYPKETFLYAPSLHIQDVLCWHGCIGEGEIWVGWGCKAAIACMEIMETSLTCTYGGNGIWIATSRRRLFSTLKHKEMPGQTHTSDCIRNKAVKGFCTESALHSFAIY